MSYGFGCFIACENGNEKWGFLSETKQRQTANVENGGKTIITRLFLRLASAVRSSFRLCFLGLGSALCCSFAFGISRIWWFVQSFVRPFAGLLVRFCIDLGFCRSFWVACGGRSFWVPWWRSFVLGVLWWSFCCSVFLPSVCSGSWLPVMTKSRKNSGLKIAFVPFRLLSAFVHFNYAFVSPLMHLSIEIPTWQKSPHFPHLSPGWVGGGGGNRDFN